MAKNKARTILRMVKKNFQDERLTHELSLTKRQKTKIRNTLANNMLTDIKFKIVWTKITTFFKRRVSIILRS